MFQNNKKRKRSNQPQIIQKNDNIYSKFWCFRFLERKEYMFVSPFYNDKMQVLQCIVQYKKWARVITVEPNKYNNYSYEIIGIIELAYPQTKDWVQQNILINAKWTDVDISPNYWIQGLENEFQQKNIIYHDEINDGLYLNN
jgi:hypothetical protein